MAAVLGSDMPLRFLFNYIGLFTRNQPNRDQDIPLVLGPQLFLQFSNNLRLDRATPFVGMVTPWGPAGVVGVPIKQIRRG